METESVSEHSSKVFLRLGFVGSLSHGEPEPSSIVSRGVQG